MSREIYDPFDGSGFIYADTVFVEEGRLTEVLGLDGQPVRYLQLHRVGFDLRPQHVRHQKPREGH